MFQHCWVIPCLSESPWSGKYYAPSIGWSFKWCVLPRSMSCSSCMVLLLTSYMRTQLQLHTLTRRAELSHPPCADRHYCCGNGADSITYSQWLHTLQDSVRPVQGANHHPTEWSGWCLNVGLFPVSIRLHQRGITNSRCSSQWARP